MGVGNEGGRIMEGQSDERARALRDFVVVLPDDLPF